MIELVELGDRARAVALKRAPQLRSLESGIVLQAYLPDSFGALVELTEWAQRRQRGEGGSRGGAGVKVRIVKGANLSMEAVEAAELVQVEQMVQEAEGREY